MSGRPGMGTYRTPKSRSRWLESVGANQICARCINECKQPATVEVVMCKGYRRAATPGDKKG